MNRLITDILKKKPHLEGPLRFYEKSLLFSNSVRALKLTARPEQHAYASADIETVFELFSSHIELPEGSLSPLKQAMEVGDIDFTRLPLGEVPAFSLPYAEDDLVMLLFLLSKPYFHALRDACRLDGLPWEKNACPLCGAAPSLVWSSHDGQRQAACPFCGTTGPVGRSGCLTCGIIDEANQKVLRFEGEEGVGINGCGLCRFYVKAVDEGLIQQLTPELADLVSLPLDIVVQEKGYKRRSPNPVGMRKIATNG